MTDLFFFSHADPYLTPKLLSTYNDLGIIIGAHFGAIWSHFGESIFEDFSDLILGRPAGMARAARQAPKVPQGN